jgi:hypothetical protein
MLLPKSLEAKAVQPRSHLGITAQVFKLILLMAESVDSHLEASKHMGSLFRRLLDTIFTGINDNDIMLFLSHQCSTLNA